MYPTANQIPLSFQSLPNVHIFSDIPAILYEKKSFEKNVKETLYSFGGTIIIELLFLNEGHWIYDIEQ